MAWINNELSWLNNQLRLHNNTKCSVVIIFLNAIFSWETLGPGILWIITHTTRPNTDVDQVHPLVAMALTTVSALTQKPQKLTVLDV